MQSQSILQSATWETFQKSTGKKVFRVGGCLLIQYQLPLGLSYLFAPEGPTLLTDDLLRDIVTFGKRKRALFVRIEPRGIAENFSLQKKLIVSKPIHPEHTAILDLTPTTEELMNSFKQKTRYNIRLAEKKGVTIETTTNPENTKIFTTLAAQTATRDGIRIHTKDYYKKMVEVLARDNKAKLYLARYQNEYVAAQIVAYHEKTATYLHGASSDSHRNIMAPYALQWHAICDAKKAGFSQYDFFGVAPSDDPNHPWAGITRFKVGFQSNFTTYPGCFDIPLHTFIYRLYVLVRSLVARKK